MLKLGANFKNHFKSMDNFCPLDVVSSVQMKTQSIMITLTIKFTINNFRMEFSCVDSKPNNPESTLVDYGVEFLIRYFISKLFLTDSKLEFVAELKIPCVLLEWYL